MKGTDAVSPLIYFNPHTGQEFCACDSGSVPLGYGVIAHGVRNVVHVRSKKLMFFLFFSSLICIFAPKYISI